MNRDQADIQDMESKSSKNEEKQIEEFSKPLLRYFGEMRKRVHVDVMEAKHLKIELA